MPNQRAKDKVFVGGFVHRDLNKILRRLSRNEKPNDHFGFIMKLVREALEHRGIRVSR